MLILQVLSAFISNSDRYTESEVRQLDFISQFHVEFRHVKRRDNSVDDALYLIIIDIVQLPVGIDYNQMAQAQQDYGFRLDRLPPGATLFYPLIQHRIPARQTPPLCLPRQVVSIDILLIDTTAASEF